MDIMNVAGFAQQARDLMARQRLVDEQKENIRQHALDVLGARGFKAQKYFFFTPEDAFFKIMSIEAILLDTGAWVVHVMAKKVFYRLEEEGRIRAGASRRIILRDGARPATLEEVPTQAEFEARLQAANE